MTLTSRRILLTTIAVLLGCAAVAPSAGAFPAAPAGIWTIAGNGALCAAPPDCGDGGPATSASLSEPFAVVADPAGNLLIADVSDNEIRRLAPDGTITRLAGSGAQCDTPASCGDG